MVDVAEAHAGIFLALANAGALIERVGSDRSRPGGRTHSVRYCRSNVRSLRGRFGSQTMIGRIPPRPPVRALALGEPVKHKFVVEVRPGPAEERGDPGQLPAVEDALAMTLLPRYLLAPGIIQL